ncbi:exonuclease SbcCD subunit D [Paenibacillus yanchengensis]|uniref:Nuclease SbcCD subunit D n=1 Tax=Paenibacillus yanchengensis TaxID=2035833 RepID=A0ABW4YNL8_9BACL
MKFFHTADWHLGKLVQGVHMTEDQRYILWQLAQEIEEERPDVVIIAGDIYDRAVPPVEAIELLNEWLEHVILSLQIPVIAISGNHDSPDRLQFGSKLMQQRGLYLIGQLQQKIVPIIIQDAYGEVHIHPVPFADPAFVRTLYSDDSIVSYDDAMRVMIEQMKPKLHQDARHILVNHSFVTPSGRAEPNTSDAERPLTLGGAEYVNADHFQPFHYVALGHLHQAHYVSQPHIRYAGSPLKYSISEQHHQKGYYIVEMDAAGECQVEKRELTPMRDMRAITVTLEQLQEQPRSDDYMYVTLLSDSPILFPMEKARQVFPNTLHVERRILSAREMDADGQERQDEQRVWRKNVDPVSLFAAFYEEVNEIKLSDSKRQLFADTYHALLQKEGER